MTVLLCQWSTISCDPLKLPDLQDLPDFRKTREKSSISTKLPSYNSITDYGKSASTTAPSSFQPIKITQEDVVQGTNSVYGSRPQLSSGGILFAISSSQGSTSAPLMSGENCNTFLFSFPSIISRNLFFRASPTSAYAILISSRNATTSCSSVHSSAETNHDGSSSTLSATKATNR